MDSPLSARQGLAQLVALHKNGATCIRSQAGGSSLLGTGSAYSALEIARIAEGLPAASRPLVAVVQDETDARLLRKDLQFFLGTGHDEGGEFAQTVLGLPDLDTSPWADVSPERSAVLRRMSVLFRLSQGGDHTGLVLVASLRAIARRVVPFLSLAGLVRKLHVNTEINRDDLIEFLRQGGYTRAPVCEDAGTFAVRGGVLDLFVPLYPFPVRVDFYGDLIESLRMYDPATQRSLRKTTEVFVHPVRETILTEGHRLRERLLEAADLSGHPSARTRQIQEQIEAGEEFFGAESLTPAYHERMVSLREYLPSKPTFYLCSPPALYDALIEIHEAGEAAYKKCLSDRRLGFPAHDFFLTQIELRELFEGHPAEKGDAPRRIESSPLAISETADEVATALAASPATTGKPAIPTVTVAVGTHQELVAEMTRARAEKHDHLLLPLVRRLRENQGEGVRSVLVSSSLQHAERLEGLLKGYGLKPLLHRPGVATLAAEQQHGEVLHRFDLLEDNPALFGRIELRVGTLLRGCDLPLDRVALYCEAEIFGEKAVRKAARAPKKPSLGDLKNLEPGAFVVHQLHGVGRYKGLTKLPITKGGVAIDFMHLEYDGGTLYLPVWRLGEVQRYVGAEGVTPKLDRLGGETWAKTKAKVSREIRQIAEELLQLYAQRQALPGHAFHLGSDEEQLFSEFEATFPFEETPDQERAIGDVLSDMESERPMDRLVCGDVGYGKTEVAIRAAAKAVLGRKQVAVLAPTTVLVEQHFATFSERLKSLPVLITSLSRFRARGEQTQVIKNVAEGKVDIVIGTHRLLSNDVRFKDLGLLIIDEEQRFGVTHKERLKKLRTEVDTLTLTATPIPRTLHMALSGMRDLSIMTTAPADRLAIRTIVARDNDDLIRDAITRELARGGQVFFVHNRVESIGERARKLRELLPTLRILVGHGQMSPEELERVMLDFVEGRADILLCTTIIESGLDIPRANTMIVDRADCFGLAQLYQLRGRIGRSTLRAFCYLLVPANEAMTADAKQRLAVLQRFSELGAGFSIASHDLEIRGAGDLLGAKQSGTIAHIGFELYTRMLEEAVAELRGQPITRPVDPDLNCDLPGFIPDDYLPDTGQRLDFYRRLSVAEDEEEISGVLSEINDRYGSPPEEVAVLGDIMVVKALGRRLHAASIELTETRLSLSLRETTPLRPEQVTALVSPRKSPWRITPDQRLVRLWQGDKEREGRLSLGKSLLADLLSHAGV
ncbi:MAG: transcription-repair coupling factor [Myxococcales bacterium]|nr:transcription-repair coupling factor [Myxococcales bacterium]